LCVRLSVKIDIEVIGVTIFIGLTLVDDSQFILHFDAFSDVHLVANEEKQVVQEDGVGFDYADHFVHPSLWNVAAAFDLPQNRFHVHAGLRTHVDWN